MLETKSETCNPCIEHPLDAPTKRLNSSQILNSVCKFYAISPNLVCGKLRFRSIVEARMVTAYLLRSDRHLNLSLKHIGMILGNKDHTTIMHSIKQIKNIMEVEPVFKDKVKAVFLETYGNTNFFYKN
jgi:chromosomal replication initiator protein